MTDLRWLRAFLWSTLWINVSEVFRYFALVMPAMRDELAAIPGVAPMSLPIFLVWGLWDCVLTLVLVVTTALVRSHVEGTLRVALTAGTLVWATLFLLFWVAMTNMALASIALAAQALPLAWLEMLIAAAIAHATLGPHASPAAAAT